MIVRGVRMYGKSDLRFEEFDIGEMGEEELLARVVTDSLCMSTHKAALQGSAHRAVPDGIDRHPVVIGHEFCAVVEKVGARAATDLRVGDLFTVQPKMFLNGEIRGPGYSFAAYGGDITHIRVPREALEGNYLLPWRGAGYFHASLTEPYSCIISALRAQYHLADDHKAHVMGPRAGGCMAVLAGCGPMGIGMAQCAMAMEAEARPRPHRRHRYRRGARRAGAAAAGSAKRRARGGGGYLRHGGRARPVARPCRRARL